MRRRTFGLTVAALAASVAMGPSLGWAQEEKKVTIGVSIPAADHGWTAGVVYHAERVAKLLMEEHPGLTVLVKTSADPATQANAVQDLAVQGIDALVILPTDPDPLVNAIQQVKDAGTFVALVDRAPSNNDNGVRDLYVAGNNPALGRVAGEYIAATTPDAAARARGAAAATTSHSPAISAPSCWTASGPMRALPGGAQSLQTMPPSWATK